MQKSIEAVLYLLSKQPDGKLNLYNLVKSLFQADVCHLNWHARPVTGDSYIAMKYGTVPSTIYDLIKGDPFAWAEAEPSPQAFERNGNFVVGTREPNLHLLSESDQMALDKGYAEYGTLPFDQVRKRNHEHPAYIKAYERKPDSPIDPSELIEDDQVRSEFIETSSALRI